MPGITAFELGQFRMAPEGNRAMRDFQYGQEMVQPVNSLIGQYMALREQNAKRKQIIDDVLGDQRAKPGESYDESYGDTIYEPRALTPDQQNTLDVYDALLGTTAQNKPGMFGIKRGMK